jgi:hypothetical protein
MVHAVALEVLEALDRRRRALAAEDGAPGRGMGARGRLGVGSIGPRRPHDGAEPGQTRHELSSLHSRVSGEVPTIPQRPPERWV